MLIHGDCLEEMKKLPDCSVDSCVCDPPYGINFMTKKWDNEIAFNTKVWGEVFRVLKHGGHLLSFGGCRTSHRMTVAIEDAGFIIRGMLGWAFSKGMPKSHNISLGIDKRKGLQGQRGKGGFNVAGMGEQEMRKAKLYKKSEIGAIEKYKPKSEEAKKWEGWGTELAPAFEPICMAMKPLKYKTYAENMIRLGTGGLNIEVCRVEGGREKYQTQGVEKGDNQIPNRNKDRLKTYPENLGRFPKNVLLEKTEEINKLFPNDNNKMYSQFEMTEEDYFYQNQALINKYYKPFYYCSKTNKKEADAGIKNKTKSELNSGGLGRKTSVDKRLAESGENVAVQGNFHPTKKPVELCSWLVMLITQPKGTVLDPFMGTAPIGIACHKNGFDYIGIEKEKEYFDLAQQRIENEKKNLSLSL